MIPTPRLLPSRRDRGPLEADLLDPATLTLASPMHTRFLLAVVLATSLVLVSPPAEAVTSWEGDAEVCMRAFASPEKSELRQLVYCMKVWAMFRRPATIPETDRKIAVPAFLRVFRDGSPQTQQEAELVLQSLNTPIPDEMKRKKGKRARGRRAIRAGQPSLLAPDRPKFEPSSCGKAATRAARKWSGKGDRQRKKGNARAAEGLYQRGLAGCEGHARSVYGMAGAFAMQDQIKEAVEYLQRLNDIGSDVAIDLLNQARVSNSFTSLRGQPDFLRLTGYVRLKLLNGCGEFGEDEVDRIAHMLKKLRHEVAEKGHDKHQRKRPYVWYKNRAKVQALLLQEVVDDPDTRVRRISWDSDFDVIVSWGVKLEKDEYGDVRPKKQPRSIDPDAADKKMKNLERKQNQALRKPEQAVNTANRVLDTPERTERRAKGAVDRTKRTLDKVENVGGKLGL